MKEIESRSEIEKKKFEDLKKKLAEDKIQKVYERHKHFEEQKLERHKFRQETSKNLQAVKKVTPLYIEKA